MSEKLLRFLLSELSTVRVRCKGCGTVTELPLDSLAGHGPLSFLSCPHCTHSFDPLKTGSSALVEFARATRKLADLGASVEVEFTLPADE